MSSDSLAILRSSASEQYQKLAEEHMNHDLTQSDRDTLKTAAGKISTHTLVGSLIGLSFGAALAWKVRSNRIKMFQALRMVEKPTHVKFANGREEAIPDLTPLLAPTRLEDFATYTFLGIAGVFLGGEMGLLSGASSARRSILRDGESKKRIETAFRGFRADVLRREVEVLESGKEGIGLGF